MPDVRIVPVDQAAARPAPAGPSGRSGPLSALFSPVHAIRRWLMGHTLTGPAAGAARPVAMPTAWHGRLALLAAAGDGGASVQVFDLQSALEPSPSSRQNPQVVSSPRDALQLLPLESSPSSSPSSSSHSSSSSSGRSHLATALAWRPNAGETLAVGTSGGVYLWDLLAKPGQQRGGAPVAAARLPPALVHATSATASAAPHTFLRLPAGCAACAVASLAWHPDGRLLAAASPDMAGLVIWDVASGEATAVSAGWAAFSLLRWSPCGNYLLAAGVGPKFYLWETGRWTWQSWALPPPPPAAAAAAATSGRAAPPPPPAAYVVGGAWSPDSKVLLLSFSSVDHLVALHLVSHPPSLKAHMLPVTLPDLRLGGEHGSSSSRQQQQQQRPYHECIIADMAWDAKGERLAVALQPPHTAAGMVAIYATATDPVVNAILVGLAKPPLPLPAAAVAGGAGRAAAAAGGGAAGTSAAEAMETEGDGAQDGPAGAAVGLAFGSLQFCSRTVAKGAPLVLSARLSAAAAAADDPALVYNLPMYFK